MSCELNLFNTEKLRKFSGVNDPAEAERKIQELLPNINEKFDNIKNQFSMLAKWKDYIEELEEILHRLENDAHSSSYPYCVWLGFRLMEEESKLIRVI